MLTTIPYGLTRASIPAVLSCHLDNLNGCLHTTNRETSSLSGSTPAVWISLENSGSTFPRPSTSKFSVATDAVC